MSVAHRAWFALAIVAVALGGWIGFRATRNRPQCFLVSPSVVRGVIVCLKHGRNLAYPPHIQH